MKAESRTARCRFHHEQRAQAILEVPISLSLILLLLVFPVIEFTSLMYTRVLLADAANEGLRYIVVHHLDQAGAATVVRQYSALAFHDMRNLGVSFAYPDGNSNPGSTVTISLTYPYLPYIGFVLPSSPTLTANATGEIVK